MIRFVTVFFALFLSSFLAAQSPVALIKGFVFSDDAIGRKEPIKNAKVKVTTSIGSIQETYTDSIGNYFFQLKNFEGSVELSAYADRNSATPGRKGNESFLNSGDRRKFDVAEGDTVIQNFFVKKAIVCKALPEINFAFNSTKLVFDSTSSQFDGLPEDGIDCLFKIMQDNPAMSVEIAGHCDSREKTELGLKRAQYVVAELVKKGIDPKRLKSKGCGSSRPLVPPSYMAAAKSKEEKEALYQKNRRAEFRVINFDFKPE